MHSTGFYAGKLSRAKAEEVFKLGRASRAGVDIRVAVNLAEAQKLSVLEPGIRRRIRFCSPI
jgi:hypothetical protein